MLQFSEIQSIPANFDAYVDENAAGIRALYGPAADAEYRATVVERLTAALKQRALRLYAAMDGPDAAALLMTGETDKFGRIHFMHVLKPWAAARPEHDLIRTAVDHFRRSSVEGISSECIAFCELDDGEVFHHLGFIEKKRVVMIADLPLSSPSRTPPPELKIATLRHRAEIAHTLVDAYRDHSSRVLHPEVRTQAGAVAFVRTALSGGYGPVEHGWSLLAGNARNPQGAVIGCRVAPDVGFILHLAVCADHQSRGIGSALLTSVAQRFHAAGLRRIALGVTWDNPARRLYERYGFAVRQELHSRVWWRDQKLFQELQR